MPGKIPPAVAVTILVALASGRAQTVYRTGDRPGIVALLTRAELLPEQDVGFFAADVYVLDSRHRDPR